MKNSIIELAQRVPVKDRNFPGPAAIHLWQRGSELLASVEPAIELISGSIYPAYMDDFTIPEWLDWQGEFTEIGFDLTKDLSLTLYWRCGVWNQPDCFVCIEHRGRETWVWSNEDIARRIFWEGFSRVPAPFDPNRMRSATSSPSFTIRRTNAVTHPGETAPIASPGWDFASISAPCFN